jgi:hypothetical protein
VEEDCFVSCIPVEKRWREREKVKKEVEVKYKAARKACNGVLECQAIASPGKWRVSANARKEQFPQSHGRD